MAVYIMSYTYTDLQTDVIAYLHRSDVASLVPGWISRTEQEIYRALMVPENRHIGTATGNATQPQIDSPDLWANLDSVRQISENKKIQPASQEQMSQWQMLTRNAGTNGTRFYRVLSRVPGTILEVDWMTDTPLADDFQLSGYVMPATDLAGDDPLAGTLLAAYPNVFLYSALIEGFGYTANQTAQVAAQQRYEAEMGIANTLTNKLAYGAGLQTRTAR
jgi:hypothetical protein